MSVISTMWNKFGQTTQTSTLGTVGDERGIPPLQKRSLMQNKGGTWGMVAVAALVGGFILWHQWQKQSMVAEKAAAENAKNASKSVASAGNDFRWSDVYEALDKPKPKVEPSEAPSPDPAPATAQSQQSSSLQSQPLQRPEKSPEELWRERRLKPTVIASGSDSGSERVAAMNARQGTGSGTSDFGGIASDELGGRLRGSNTAEASARLLPDRDFLITKGTMADCVMDTRLVSSVSGMVRCVQSRDLYSDNMKVLLSERGSIWTGQYRGADIKPGVKRLFVLWERIKTPKGVVIHPNSPGTDPLGGSGLEGEIDTHFWERFGAAIMISLIDDFATAAATRDRPVTGDNNTIVGLPSIQASAQRLAEKALESSVNIPPTLYKHHGDPIGIFVARDLDFSSVYELRVKQADATP